MLLVDLLGWWYSHGFVWIGRQFFVVMAHKIMNFFSVQELLKTLFAPFRQDSTQVKNAPVGIRLQALGGNIISRIFGFIVRSVLIIIGLLFVMANYLMGCLVMIIWPLIPLSPILVLLLIVFGVGA